jgi:hypothetical protein
MAVTSLPEELIEILAGAYGTLNTNTNRRWTLRELAEFSTQQLGRAVSKSMVERAINPIRAERARDAREIARACITAQLPAQLETLDTMLAAIAGDFTTAEDADKRSAALDAFNKALTLKMRYSGVGERLEMGGGLDLTSDGKPIAAMTTDELTAHIAGLRARIEGRDEG